MKHVEFYSKNKFEKLVHLVGFIIRSEMAAATLNFEDSRWLELLQNLSR